MCDVKSKNKRFHFYKRDLIKGFIKGYKLRSVLITTKGNEQLCMCVCVIIIIIVIIIFIFKKKERGVEHLKIHFVILTVFQKKKNFLVVVGYKQTTNSNVCLINKQKNRWKI